MNHYISIEWNNYPIKNNEISPRGISVTELTKGNYYDAIKSETNQQKYIIPTLKDFKIIEKYASFVIPKNIPLISKTLDENVSGNIKGIIYNVLDYDKCEHEELSFNKNEIINYVLIRIKY